MVKATTKKRWTMTSRHRDVLFFNAANPDASKSCIVDVQSPKTS
jgi:hypothetical protein